MNSSKNQNRGHSHGHGPSRSHGQSHGRGQNHDRGQSHDGNSHNHSRSHSQNNPQDRIYGIHVIHTILKKHPERVIELFIQESRNDNRDNGIKDIISLAKNHSISIQTIKSKELDRWFPESTHQGIAARIKPSQTLTEADLPEFIENATTPPLFLILDGVQDPHNLGACLRTADAAGATGVIISKANSASITPTVRKIASGAAESVPVFEVSNLARALDTLKKLNVWLVGTEMETKDTLFDVDLKGAIGLVLGSEGTGLRKLTKECCDFLVHIPMCGVVGSLNVSVAAGICLYEAVRQRLVSDPGI